MRQWIPFLKAAALVLLVLGFVGLLLGLSIARETPVGAVKGRVLDELGKPFARVSVSVVGEGQVISGVTDGAGQYLITDVPAGANYSLYATNRGYETAALPDYRRFSVREGDVTELDDIKLRPRPPAIYASIPAVFIPGEKVTFPLRGYSRRQVAQVELAVYTYDFAGRVRDLGGRADTHGTRLSDWKDLRDPVYTRNLSLKTDGEGYFSRDVTLPVEDVGGYLIHLRLESTESLLRTLVTDLGLVAKRAPGKTLVYAVSFSRRSPVSGAKLKFFARDGRLDTAGATGPDGVFITESLPRDHVTILGASGKSCAINYTYGGSEDDLYKCYIYTDRPVYRPGHKVQFKGVLRKSVPGHYTPVSSQAVSVQITDPEGDTIKRLDLATNAFGSFAGEIDLDAEAQPGYYSIVASYAGTQHYGSFNVEEYRKPEYKAAVAFGRPSYVGGEDIRARVEASYYFGAPVAYARVKYTVYKSPDYFYYYPDEESDTSFYDDFFQEEEHEDDYGYGYGEVVLEAEGATDESGVFNISVPTRKTTREERYTIDAAVMDPSGRSVDISGGVLVTPAMFAMRVQTDRWFYKPGQTANLRIYAVDYRRRRVPNVAATVTITDEAGAGQKRKRTLLTKRVRLDTRGQGALAFMPRREGYFRVEVSARDRRGNMARGEDYIWVADEDWDGVGYQPSGLEVRLDKRLYTAGDTARVMINTPDKGAWVLFTIEGRRIFSHSVIQMTSTSTVVEVPIPAEYTPNAYACVSMVKGKRLVSDSRPIFVSPKGNFLNVRVTTDKKRYLPGESVTYTLQTSDSAGKGVPAEVSLGVVDESLYAVREDRTQDIRKFFYGPRYNLADTSISFSDYYYGGEDKFAGKVRRYFPDTAYWNPTVVTDESGRASVTFNMPDNLTTWRATARAVTVDTAVGSAVDKVTVTKNLLVRLQTPRFFRQRDSIKLIAVVHNYTPREQRVRVWLTASGIRLEDDEASTLVLGPNGAGTVQWRASVPHPGTARVTVYARGQGDQDAMEMEAPILPHGVEESVADSGDTAANRAEFELVIPEQVIRDASVLEMGFTSSVAGAAMGLTRAIEEYRYDSAEGIMDVLLPNVVIYQAMKQLGVATQEQYDSLRKLVDRDLRTVYRWQLPGGGWGWWEYGQKDAWMTAYVVYGLLRAREAGLPVREDVLKRGIEATAASVPDEGDVGKRSTMIYVLALAGVHKSEWVSRVLSDKQAGNCSVALLMLTLHKMGQTQRARALIPRLQKGAVESRLHCYWPEIFEWGFYSCNRYETTAYAVRALLAVDPENPRVTKAVRWLLAVRRGGRYEGNYDTASVVYALADYLMVHKPPIPDYRARVYLNGRLLSEFDMTPDSIYKPQLRVKAQGGLIRPGRNTVRIEKEGAGQLFYSAFLRYYSTAENLPATKSKISIRRDYFRLELVRKPQEGLVYKPAPLGDSASVGELIRCRITITSPKDFRYLIVEDMLPSGCEVVQRKRPDYWDSWDYWWSGEAVHDNRMSFFLWEVYEGKRVIEYDFRPELRGSFHVMPAAARGHFEPDIYAHCSERRLIVR